MSELQQEYQDYISNPLHYYANTQHAIDKRKNKANKPSNMKIVDFTQNPHNNSFTVLIKGNRGIIYNVFFSEQSITCSCPDYQKHTVKPICKHMFKLICLSENHDIFNNSMLLTDLMNPQYLARILESTLRIIDVKKMERYGGPQNQISIERDECCPICYGDFDADVSQCSKCKHVFHTNCVRLSWNSSAYSARGRCPMCRDFNGFAHLQGGPRNYDPWEIYNFSPAPAPEPEEAPVPQPQLQDDLVEENNDDSFPNNDGIPQNEGIFNDEFFLPEQVEEPEFMAHLSNDDISGQGPNEDPNDAIASDSETQSNSLSELEDYEFIDIRIKTLNIFLFIFETVNIIFNQIKYPEDGQN